MKDREIPLAMAALAGVMANPVHTHTGKTPEQLADLALGAARATVAKLEQLDAAEPTSERVDPARYDVDELGALERRIEAIEQELQTRPAPTPPAT